MPVMTSCSSRGRRRSAAAAAWLLVLCLVHFGLPTAAGPSAPQVTICGTVPQSFTVRVELQHFCDHPDRPYLGKGDGIHIQWRRSSSSTKPKVDMKDDGRFSVTFPMVKRSWLGKTYPLHSGTFRIIRKDKSVGAAIGLSVTGNGPPLDKPIRVDVVAGGRAPAARQSGFALLLADGHPHHPEFVLPTAGTGTTTITLTIEDKTDAASAKQFREQFLSWLATGTESDRTQVAAMAREFHGDKEMEPQIALRLAGMLSLPHGIVAARSLKQLTGQDFDPAPEVTAAMQALRGTSPERSPSSQGISEQSIKAQEAQLPAKLQETRGFCEKSHLSPEETAKRVAQVKARFEESYAEKRAMLRREALGYWGRSVPTAAAVQWVKAYYGIEKAPADRK